MSLLTVYKDDAPGVAVISTEDGAEIAATLAEIGVRFERWESPVVLADDADSETVLAAYRPFLDKLMGESGAGSADVIRIGAHTPNKEALRAKFLSEHTHSEDEVRFFVRGAGSFILHVDGKIYDAHCVQGDLISVPTGIRHWFDAGETPEVTALRVFTDTTGWIANYTGDDVAERFPARFATR